MTRVKTTTRCSISKANVKNKTKVKTWKERKKEEKACLGGCISNCEKGFQNSGSGLCLANDNSGTWRQRCLLPPEASAFPGHSLNNRPGHCQIRQETGEWALTQDVSGLNSLHSITYAGAPLISQLTFFLPSDPAFANSSLSFPHSFGVIPSLKANVC